MDHCTDEEEQNIHDFFEEFYQAGERYFVLGGLPRHIEGPTYTENYRWSQLSERYLDTPATINQFSNLGQSDVRCKGDGTCNEIRYRPDNDRRVARSGQNY